MCRLKNKKFVLAILFCIIVIFVLFYKLYLSKEEDKKNSNNQGVNNTNNTENVDYGKNEFNEKEQKIIDAIYNNSDINNSFDKSKLSSFEIIDLKNYGYYKSEDNILYIRVRYKSTCSDGTHDCDRLALNLKNHILEEDDLFFFIKINIDTYDDIEIIDGISVHINSDWVSKNERIQ